MIFHLPTYLSNKIQQIIHSSKYRDKLFRNPVSSSRTAAEGLNKLLNSTIVMSTVLLVVTVISRVFVTMKGY